MSEIVNREFELENSRVIVDPRPFHKKVWDSLEGPSIPFYWAIFASVVILIWPGFIPFALFVFGILWLAVVSKSDVLPIHLPLSANKIDKNDPKPGDSGFYMARGSFYLGYIREKKTELWVSFKAMTQHFLIFGTTGAGKTESIVSYIVNYLAVGSGVAFQDAKAAPKAMIQMATFCRIFGRDGDFRVTNYITGLSAENKDPAERMSNDAAVFSRGSAESNTQMLTSLMPPSEGENKIFAERAVALLSALMPGLTDLRELGKLQIDPGTIRKFMGFKQFALLYRNNNISMRSRNALQAYLESLSGYDESKEISEQQDEVTRQFGFAQAYFTRSLASLSDTYGHIYMTGQGEIDYQDAVLNGRILLTLLPSMEKSGEELGNLGKIVLTATKNGMVVGLGTVFEGSADDIVHNLATNSDIPYGVINDENAYMLVEGQEMINAQARGLGFGVITGTQDIAGMMESLSKTTKQILANSAFKQIMYLDDKDTTELAVEFAGEARVLVRNQFQRDGDLGSVFASSNVSLEKVPRLSGTAIKKQGLGQAYLMYQGKLHEAQVFNHGIQEKSNDPLRCYVKHWFPVRMAKTKVPEDAVIERYIKALPLMEWQELRAMLRDDARHMLREMTSHFSSMILMNNVARMNLDSEHTTVLARSFLEEMVEDAEGLIKLISNADIRTQNDTSSLLLDIGARGNTGQVAIHRTADEAGLDMFADFAPPPPMPEKEDSSSEDSTGGGGSLKARNAPQESTEGLLESFLGDEVDDAPPAVHSMFQNDQPEIERTIEAPKTKSDIAQIVERSMGSMPWMTGAVEYSEIKDSFSKVEMFLGTATLEEANEAIDKAFGNLTDALEYPKTNMKSSILDRAKAVGHLKGFIDQP